MREIIAELEGALKASAVAEKNPNQLARDFRVGLLVTWLLVAALAIYMIAHGS